MGVSRLELGAKPRLGFEETFLFIIINVRAFIGLWLADSDDGKISNLKVTSIDQK